ncbi:MAG: glutathione peroxidase [Saprospiraceae bacterium]|nr:glutathione peroxidase [Saprospiraceae bacterium]
MNDQKTIKSFKVRGIDGKEIDFASFGNKKIMIVNVASECGFTSQYQQLQELYNHFESNLVIIGCPCNDFGNQEPGDEKSITLFCEKNYGVTFPLTEKISITGKEVHPLYKWLTNKSENGVMDSEVSWNFQKYLLDENGHLEKVLPPSTLPIDPEVLDWLAG